MVDVVIIDSGLGGISLLPTFFKELNFKKYIYFADTKNLPYGTKSLKQLLDITILNVKNIIKEYKPQIIVFGCNTIGSTIFDEICKIFPDQMFFSIKPCVQYEEKNTLLLATNKTINSLRSSGQIKNNIILCKMNKLANKVENNIQNPQNIVPYLKYRLSKYKNISCIILGCTHYFFVKNQISLLFPNAKIIDGVNNLVGQIKESNNSFVDNNIKSKKVKVKMVFSRKVKTKKVYKLLIKKFMIQAKQ